MQEEEKKEHIEIAESKIKRFWRFMRRLALVTFSLFIVFSLIFQIPAVQKWAVNSVSQSLSKQLETKVSVSYLYFSWFDRLRLNDFYVQDYGGDTLLYTQQLRANFNLNPITLLLNGIEVERIDLRNGAVNLKRPAGTLQTNLQKALEKLTPSDSLAAPKKKRPVRLNLKRLDIHQVQFFQRDSLRNKNLLINLDRGRVGVRQMDLPRKAIAIEVADLNGLSVSVEDFGEPVFLPEELAPLDAPADSTLIDSLKFLLTVEDFHISNSRFSLHNYRKAPTKITPADELDYKHMEVSEINMEAECFTMSDWHFAGENVKISGKEQSGLILENLSAATVVVTPEEVELIDVLLQTPDSEVGDTLIFSFNEYLDWQDFTNEVEIEAHLNNAKIALKDIITFAPGLRSNPFFSNNRNEILLVDGDISGEINDLRGRKLTINLSDDTRLRGRFSSNNLAVRNEEAMNLRLEELSTSMKTLRQLIPNFNPPTNFDRLGRLNFRGRFDGFFVDFVAYGDLRTSIGRAQMDMRMNLKDGRDRANYSGNLKLTQFDLGKWSLNEDLGTITLNSEVINGVGLSSHTAAAELIANIETFTYKGYLYENASLSGKLYENFFNGDFEIRDDNVDFGFTGEVDLTDTIPRFDFKAQVKKLDLKKLNLSEREFVMAGALDLELLNSSLSDLKGTAALKDFSITEGPENLYSLDSLSLISDIDSLGRKTLIATSDVLEADIRGLYEIDQLPDIFIQYLQHNFSDFTDQWGLKPIEKQLADSDFDYDIRIIDSKGFNRILDPKLGDIKNATAEGYYHQWGDQIFMDLSVPELIYDNIRWVDIVAILDAEGPTGEFDLAIDSTIIKEKTVLSAITLLSFLNQDTIDFGLNYASGEGLSLLDNLNLNGQLFIVDSTYYQVKFQQSNLIIFETPWAIRENNQITFGNQYIETQDFVLTNQEKVIRLDRVGKKGLKLSLANFDFNFIEDYWDYEPLDFSGKFNAIAELQDMFTLSGFRATTLADTFRINKDDWGALRLDARAIDFKNPIEGFLTITKDTTQLIAEGYFNPTDIVEDKKTPVREDKKANFFAFDVDVAAFPLSMLEYFLGATIENTVGTINADLSFSGPPKTPKISGDLHIADGATTVSFLKTRYYFPSADITADSNYFNAAGNTIYDKYNHPAYLFGGIRHNYLKDFRFDARLNTPRFLGVDTQKGDNKMFYGHALGKGDVRFTGTFQQPNVYVNAVVGDSTRIVIPISYEREASELKFIKFVDKSALDPGGEGPVSEADLKGVSLEMDLTITEEADAEIVFDEQAGDVIKGNGNGNIRILMPRGGGDFRMFGDYVIEQGDYLFTLYGVFSKDFRIKRGGRIEWTGDPFQAEIDIEAEYKDLNAAVANFIQEYLVNLPSEGGSNYDNIKNEASQGTKVDLTMQLSGPLLKPIINFDIRFPNLTGPLKNYTDSKLRLLKQDPNELNRQVFGLLVVGQFINTDIASQGSEILYNTVSEFVSNQLSLLLTELFSEFIADGRVLSGIDFDIAYNQYQAVDLGEGQDFNRGDEFEVRLKQNFFNDRLTILVGGNVDFGGSVQAAPEASGAFVGNDLVFEYVLSQRDRSLKLRVYQRLQPDIGGGRRLQVGTGLSFRKEFDSFSEFVRSLKKEGRAKGGS